MSNSLKYSSSRNSQQTNKSILARKLVHEKLFVSNKWVFVLKVLKLPEGMYFFNLSMKQVDGSLSKTLLPLGKIRLGNDIDV